MAKKILCSSGLPELPYIEQIPLFRFSPHKTKVCVPFAWAVKYNPCTKFPPISQDYLEFFCGIPRPEQIDVLKESFNKLKCYGHCLIKCPPGFGKTFIALNLCDKIALPCLIITHRAVLIQQWLASIQKFMPKCIVLTEKSALKKGVNFKPVVGNLMVVGPSYLNKKNIWKNDVPLFLVVDEVHQLTSPQSCQALLNIKPRFLLGLSATPLRYDIYHPAVSWFFGSRNSMVIRKQTKSHTVIKVSTCFQPVVKIFKGQLDWNAVIKDMAEDKDRNDCIVNCLAQFPNIKWIVLCKRLIQVELLSNALKLLGTVDQLCGSKSSWDTTAWCLVGTFSKIGVGFDAIERQGLCLAADVDRYFEQCLGRLRHSNGLVLEFNDNFGPLNKHAKNREKIYNTLGCNIISTCNNRNLSKFLK